MIMKFHQPKMMMRISKSTELYIADFTDNIIRLMSKLKKTEHSTANFTDCKLNVFYVQITESEHVAWSGLPN
ncbi:hypothetical protein TIFTF001_039100 [Ficus carica]|uniref:Uncharacterized protein n=1 Tax=Ficus carica TaxID=3494 RepID=A0AA88JDR9_FICCA|nr:hypothetical protein TIFTF001_039100 [Ficus carica]